MQGNHNRTSENELLETQTRKRRFLPAWKSSATQHFWSAHSKPFFKIANPTIDRRFFIVFNTRRKVWQKKLSLIKLKQISNLNWWKKNRKKNMNRKRNKQKITIKKIGQNINEKKMYKIFSDFVDFYRFFAIFFAHK